MSFSNLSFRIFFSISVLSLHAHLFSFALAVLVVQCLPDVNRCSKG
jgi:hypothetical protein